MDTIEFIINRSLDILLVLDRFEYNFSLSTILIYLD